MRLQRVGRKHEPSFRLVLTDSKNSTKSGRFGEILGSYDPRKSTEALNTDRIKHWISQGVGLTATVNNLLIKKGIIRGKKIDVSAGEGAPKASVIEAPEAEEVVVEEAPVPEESTAPIAEPEVVEAVPEPEAVPPTENKEVV